MIWFLSGQNLVFFPSFLTKNLEGLFAFHRFFRHSPSRYNDKLTKWDTDDRRSLDFERYGLRFGPVRSKDSGTYLCLLNNRMEPDAPIVLTVEGRDGGRGGRGGKKRS